MPSSNQIPFDLPGFEIDTVETDEDCLIIQAHSRATVALCPLCGEPSGSVHSRYSRAPRDLPCNGCCVRLVLGVRRFRCPNERCPRKTFAERVTVVPVHGQRTARLTAVLEAIIREVPAETGARITRHLNMAMSADTLLRVLRQAPRDPLSTPRVLGIDDWAFKKGKRYGTILVDLEHRHPVDLLPDRTAETLEAWLKAHPGIEIITRDRSHDYIRGITAGAPQAIQIADRWHLLRNLHDVLQRMMESYADILRTVANQFRPQSQLIPEQTTRLLPPAKPNLRLAEVKYLAAQGYSQRAIARSLKMSRNTVRRYLASDDPPTYWGRGARSQLTPYISYLEQRWVEGCHNSRILWEEICQQGYPGSYGNVRRFVKRYRISRQSKQLLPPPPLSHIWSRCQMAWLLVLDPASLSPQDAAYLEALCQASNDIAAVYILAQRFVAMIQQRQPEALDPWLADAQSGSVSQLATFATGLLRDYDAIRAALEFEWSNGQVEGQVNRLKVLKRMMYGRANFELLKLRVLHPP